ncbi:MAG: ssDNA-binding domain-containing protein [Rhodospirillaceae bacterium]|nr:ssDNA-binding domain-containing protein [Rhodospirillaceae bacterium]
MKKRFSAPARADVYTRITAEIIAAIEAGPGTWRLPWHHDGSSTARPTNVASSRRYRGINRLALWVAAMTTGYTSGIWGTYRSWKTVGAQVRKGERATTVVYWQPRTGRGGEDAGEGEDSRRSGFFARAFAVFNIRQVDGYVLPTQTVSPLPDTDRIPAAEAFIANLGIKTVFGGSDAYYMPPTDTVHMPDFAAFRDAASFYGTWVHENGHASGHKRRLDRDLSGRFGSASYAAEECCVEILSGLILADLGIAHHPRPDHAAYIASWLKVLKDDPRAIFTAASKAQQAADWMHAQQPQSSKEEAA